jgi:uncharacterized protein
MKLTLKHAVAVILLVSSVVAPVAAAQPDESMEILLKWADQGNAKSQLTLGIMYEFGMGAPQDYVEAIKWFRKAADQGSAQAQSELGNMYEDGHGVPQDDAEAVTWFRKAADQGYDDGQFRLGLVYEVGRGVRRDDREAAKWYRLAAEQGHIYAQRNLGLLYASGNGVPQDYVLAHMWFNLSAAHGYQPAIYERGALAKLHMTPAQVAEAQSSLASGSRLSRRDNPRLTTRWPRSHHRMVALGQERTLQDFGASWLGR